MPARTLAPKGVDCDVPRNKSPFIRVWKSEQYLVAVDLALPYLSLQYLSWYFENTY